MREAVCVCACVGGGVGVGSSVNVHKKQARELLKSRLKGRRLMLGAREGGKAREDRNPLLIAWEEK